ncbi:MAG: kelch repeat-containing protein [candidate division WOR-3 bacterium]
MQKITILTTILLATLVFAEVSPDYAPGTVMLPQTNEGPADPSWFTKRPFPTTRAHCMVSPVIEVDGVKKYYLFGGPNVSGGAYTNECWEYNTVLDTWIQKAPMPTARGIGRAVVAGGKIYVIGGCVTFGSGLNVVEIYDPVTNTWTTGPSMPVGNHDFGAAVYRDTWIYVCGGGNWSSGSPPTANVYVLNRVTGVWSTATPMPTPMGTPGCGIIGNKIIMATGYVSGAGSNIVQIGTINPADPTQITWTSGPSMPGSTVYRANSGTCQGFLYIMGGNLTSGVSNQAYKFDPATNTWTQLPNMPTARSNVYGLGTDPAGKVYFPVGYSGTAYLTVHEMLDDQVYANDVGVDAIHSPGATHLVNTPMTPRARVKNYGTAAQASFSVVCSIIGTGGAVRYTNTQTAPALAPGDTALITFTTWTPTTSENVTVIVRTLLANDQNPDNNRMTRTTIIGSFLAFADFNDPTFPPPGWQAVIISGTYNWERFTSGTYPTCTPYEGEGMAGYRSWYASSGSQARLFTQVTPTGPSLCTLKFYMMHDPGYSTVQESVIVETSLDGTNFTRVAAFRRYEPTQGWQEHAVYLGNFSTPFYVGFRALSGYGNNMYIDFVRVTGALPMANDIGVEAIRAPGAVHQINTSMTPVALIKNYGTNAATNIVVRCSIIGSGGAVRYTASANVASLGVGDTARVSFTSWTPTISENVTVIMRTFWAQDQNPNNDRLTRTTLIGAITYYDFETSDGGFIPDPAAGGWEWGVPTSGPGSAYSGQKLWATVLGGNYVNNADWKLTTPTFTASVNNPVLKFWHWYYIETNWDGGNVKLSTDGGATWNVISPVGGYNGVANTANVAIPGESCYTGSMQSWNEAVFNLPVNAGQQFSLRWHFGSDASVVYAGWYVDDVMLIGAAAAGISEGKTGGVQVTALKGIRNPVRGGGYIGFSLAAPSDVRLSIYDASGRLVRTLVSGYQGAGEYNIFWNGRDDANREVSEGIYFYKLETTGYAQTRKLIYTR